MRVKCQEIGGRAGFEIRIVSASEEASKSKKRQTRCWDAFLRLAACGLLGGPHTDGTPRRCPRCRMLGEKHDIGWLETYLHNNGLNNQ